MGNKKLPTIKSNAYKFKSTKNIFQFIHDIETNFPSLFKFNQINLNNLYINNLINDIVYDERKTFNTKDINFFDLSFFDLTLY